IGERHPELGRLRLVVARAGEQDVMTLMAECAAPAATLREAVVATLRAVTKLGGEGKLVAPGSLPNDGKMIADERPGGERSAGGLLSLRHRLSVHAFVHLAAQPVFSSEMIASQRFTNWDQLSAVIAFTSPILATSALSRRAVAR